MTEMFTYKKWCTNYVNIALAEACLLHGKDNVLAACVGGVLLHLYVCKWR